MPEIKQTLSQSQITQQFIEFVMMQAQQASLYLGKIPNPATGETVKNLEAARLFIDQLEMIREKTRGNLSSDESEILNHILSELRFTYVETAAADEPKKENKIEAKLEELPTTEKNSADQVSDSEGKKKYSKNYGA